MYTKGIWISLLLALLTACGGDKSLEEATLDGVVDLCDLSEHGFVEFVGAAATGSAVTAVAAGTSVAILAGVTSTVIITAPAIDPTFTGAAIATATAYGSLKAYCNKDAIYEWIVETMTAASEIFDELLKANAPESVESKNGDARS